MIIEHDFRYGGLDGKIIYRSEKDYGGTLSWGSEIIIEIDSHYGCCDKRDLIDEAKTSFGELEILTHEQKILRMILRIDTDPERNIKIVEK